MAFDAFALILAMLALGMAFARLRAFPDNAGDVIKKLTLDGGKDEEPPLQKLEPEKKRKKKEKGSK